MPVTAKFSREFYDKLGHEVVDELVNHLNTVDASYRSELAALNELNFARFTAEMKTQLAQTETRLARWMFAFWVPTAIGIIATATAVVGLLVRP